MIDLFNNKYVTVVPRGIFDVADDDENSQGLMYSGFFKGADDLFVYLSTQLNQEPEVAVNISDILHIEVSDQTLDDVTDSLEPEYLH